MEREARRRALNLRPFVGQIYEYAVDHRRRFSKPLEEGRPEGGRGIPSAVPVRVRTALNEWAKRKRSPRGLLCSYILEKALEDDLLDQIFADPDD